MKSRRKEGQADKQGLYQRKRSDRVLTAYTQCTLGWAASEEFGREVKHNLIYKL